MILGDFAPVDGEVTVDDDCILVINPTTLGTAAFFTYLDKTTADAIAIEEGGEAGDFDEYIGWWDENIGVFEDDAKRDSYPVVPGNGFMGYFEGGNEISFTSSGETPSVTTSFLPNTLGTRSPVFANYLPREITLKYMAPYDGESTVDDDCILVINPTTLGTAAFFTYLDKTTADAIAIEEGGEAGDLDEYIGWWDENIGVFEDDAKRDSYVVNPGAGFMGYFESGNEIRFQLPAATATLL